MSTNQILSLAEKNYAFVKNTKDMGIAVGNNQRCAYKTKFANVPRENKEINRLAKKVVDFQTDLRIQCAHCDSSLNSEGIAWLLMSGMYANIAGGGKHLQALKNGKCPQCGKKHCFYIYDPFGF
jgi:hypothetical protein